MPCERAKFVGKPQTLTPISLRVRVSGGGDINAGNNQVVSEIRGLTLGAANQTLGYINGNSANASLNWNGASGNFDFGAAVLIVPPSGNYVVNNLQAFVSSNVSDDLVLEIRDNDGANGLPGTSLGLLQLAAASVQQNTWNTLTLPSPVAVDDDGFYLVWYQRGSTLFLGTLSNQLEPVSRRNYELLSAAFSVWHSNATADLMLRVNASSLDTLPDNIFANGFE